MAVDTFIHSWNVDLAEELKRIYSPVSCLFENNEMYADEIKVRCKDQRDFSGISQALSFKRVIQMKEEYERANNVYYDIVVLYRPDVLIWSDINLGHYQLSRGMFVNAHPGKNGDFHFVMSSEDANSFKGLYDSSLMGNPYKMHFWIKNYVENFMKRQLIMDGIVPGKHQEVLRPHKMKLPVSEYGIKPDFFKTYGVSPEDLS